MKNNKNNNCNFPTLRFPEFSGEWKKDIIGNVISVKSEKYNPHSNRTEFICVELESISQGTGELLETFNSAEQKSIKNKFSPGTVLFGKLRPYLRKFYLPYFEGVCSSEIWVMRSNKIEPAFLYSFIQTPYFISLANQSSGSKMPRADWGLIETSKIAYPPNSAERVKIGKFLKLIDERIATQNKIIEEYKKLKNALAESLYYPKKSQELLKLKGLNSKWEQCFLKDVVENFCRRNKSHIQYPMYSVTNDLGFVPQSEKFEERTMMGEDISSYKVINKGDFAYNPARINVGSIAKYEGDNPCMISSLYVCFRPKYNISSEWLQHLLKSQRMIYNYNLFGEGGVRIYLFFPNFGRIKISIPPLEEQKKIAAVISTIEQKISVENFILDKLNTQKSFLLTKMFI
ncbi:restriction endonuclease subunit S [Bacteroides fragilis]|uniref:restriction endonuclease subunit S n=2 Tax=Bacteroides fragilis TaxID=817 RepID=UPI0013DC72E6|nr:restriction endonuclease subunit S [Bacteroides fragilis]MBK1430636.1 restriction endonuclease subunit S [Bacteroides fragilis]MCA5604313.1 restriction endonuclease subunit S [Bacteroides fragilis]UBH47584.1 restriction endonuclease subunit S [Bacteroides fragilis]